MKKPWRLPDLDVGVQEVALGLTRCVDDRGLGRIGLSRAVVALPARNLEEGLLAAQQHRARSPVAAEAGGGGHGVALLALSTCRVTT